MDYALAKRLKDAGWPQPDFRAGSDCEGDYIYSEDLQETAYAPTIDELIEALPRDYDGYALTITADIGRGGFKAGYPTKYVWGDTLWIALSELWLTLEMQEALKKECVK
jgi:hypothetical protein